MQEFHSFDKTVTDQLSRMSKTALLGKTSAIAGHTEMIDMSDKTLNLAKLTEMAKSTVLLINY